MAVAFEKGMVSATFTLVAMVLLSFELVDIRLAMVKIVALVEPMLTYTIDIAKAKVISI